MAKIRNISPDALTIGYGFTGPRTVEPDAVIEVPDVAVSAYVERVEATGVDENGDTTYRVLASDLWAPVDAAAAQVPNIPAADAASSEEN